MLQLYPCGICTALLWHAHAARCLLQFKDRARQKQRQQTLKQQLSQERPKGKAQNRQKSRTAVEQPIKKAPAAKRRLLEKQEDDASLVEDYRQLKKLKNGRISQVWTALI